ncbi:MAG: restriction endonuclease [Armatimonadota bacterium]
MKIHDVVSQLLAEMGFENVEVTKLSGDGGIDVRGTLVVGTVRINNGCSSEEMEP